MIKAVLFDLDATLLPMDQDLILKTYIGMLAKKMEPHGYPAADFADAIWRGSYEMIKNDGSRLNSDAFWDYFCERFGSRARDDEPLLDAFYQNEYRSVKSMCGYAPDAKVAVEAVRSHGAKAILATNPLFPAVATNERIRWAGLSPDMFDYITTYDNSRYSKPNPKYYIEIAERMGIKTEECLMVGNDTGDDMSAAKAGMQVYLVTDNLINKSGEDISKYENGTLAEFDVYLDTILKKLS